MIDKPKKSPEFGKSDEDDEDDEDSAVVFKQTNKDSDSSLEQNDDTEQPATFFDFLDTEDQVGDIDHEMVLSQQEVDETLHDLVSEKEVIVEQELQSQEHETPEELAVITDAAFLSALRERMERGERIISDEQIEEVFVETVADLELDASDTYSTTEEASIHSPPSREISDEESAGSSPPPTRLSSVDSSGPFEPDTPVFPILQTSPPSRTTPSVVETSKVQSGRNRGRDFLVGAVVGYVIGRRGGRRRSEIKLQPKIDQLERQVGLLHDAVEQREQRIRALAASTARRELSSPQKPDSGVVHDRLVLLADKRSRREETLRVREEKSLQHLEKNAEKIGALKMSALDVFVEKRLLDGSENSPKRKAVEVMTEQELLGVVSGVVVDRASIVAAYERGEISLQALREIAKRYLRSGDYATLFRSERKIELNKPTDPLSSSTVHAAVDSDVSSDSRPAHSDTRKKTSGPYGASKKSMVTAPFTPSFVLLAVVLGVVCAFVLLLIFG